METNNGAHGSTVAPPTDLAPLAIVGMDCCLPGANDLEQFEELLFASRSGVAELPTHRIERELYFDRRRGQPGKTYTLLGGTVPARDVDLHLLGLSPQQAALFDPVHLRFAEVAVRAWTRAGFRPHDPQHRRTGVFVGHSGATLNGGGLSLATQIEEGLDFLNDLEGFRALPQAARQRLTLQVSERIRRDRPTRRPGHVPRYEAYSAAALPAQILGLQGPRIVCDAACASSLFAMQQAMTAIRLGRIDAAIVGGATTNGVDNLILFSQSQACSDIGSSPFDNAASGLISSEGYAAVVIVSQATAHRLQLPVLGLISGLGIASDGRGKSLWAPRAEGQQLAIRRAYPAQQPLSIDYLEAHATSTQLGDATELQAVHAVRTSAGHAQPPLLIGSLKSNLGHTLETAGVAGLVKLLLALRRGKIPASLNYRNPNQSFEWNAGTVEVVSSPRSWQPRFAQRRAAVSAFGIGGLNAHLFIQEALASANIDSLANVETAVDSREPIAIVGRGVIVAGAHQLAQFRALLRSGHSEIGPAPEDRWRKGIGVRPAAAADSFSAPHARGGYVRNYNFDGQSYRIPPKQVRQANPLQMMLLDAVTQAIQEVDQGTWKVDRQRTGVVIGTIFSGDFGNQLQLGLRLPEIAREVSRELFKLGLPAAKVEALLHEYRQLVLSQRPALLDETGSFTASTLASRIAKTFDLMGGACAIDVDDASGLAALSVAVDQLRSGTWEVAICGAAERSMDLSRFEQLDLSGKLVRSGRPEDVPEDCRQILPGEGAVVLMLERLSVAQAAGHRILGIIDDVKCQPGEEALAKTNSPVPRDRQLIQQIGYLCGAQSLVEILKHSLNWESEVSSAGVAAIRIASQTNDGICYEASCHAEQTLSTAASLAANPPSISTEMSASMIQQSVPTNGQNARMPQSNSHDSSSPQSANSMKSPGCRTVRLQAATRAQLLQLLEGAIRQPEECWSQSVPSFASQLPERLAIIADSPAQLQERLEGVRKQLQRGRTQGVFEPERALLWRAGPVAPRVAWVFPGQGSQYAGAPSSLTSATVLDCLHGIDGELERSGLPVLLPQLTSNQAPALSDIWWNQLWVLGMSVALTAELRQQGGRPDVVLGHSFGEYSAMVACGTLSISQALRMVKSRADAVAMTVREGGQLISVRGTPHAVEAAVRSSGLPAVITHYNAPQQTVIATARDQVEAVRKSLSAVNLASVQVAVPVAYHTDRLAGAEELLRNSFSHERFLPPASGFLSTTSARYLAEPDELRQTLTSHLTLPVLYVPAVERLLADGVEILLEVGPNQILSRLNQEIAGDRALCLSLDVPGRSHAERLLMMQAALEIAGRVSGSQGFAARGSSVGAISGTSTPDVPPSIADDHAVLGAVASNNEVEIVDLRRTRRKEKSPAPSPSEDAAAVRETLPTTNGHAVADRSSGQGPDLQEVRNFLLTVVVDLTGYSPDVIDFAADLEADLGVDSIKKAQVVGELAECFELSVAPSGVTMADLKTLDDIAAIGVKYGTSRQETSSASVASLPSAAPERYAPHSRAEVETAASDTANGSTGLDLKSIERFLIDLVVDQTGYSPDVVDLDADMEGDLGIDSIKQAQLLGEVQQQFELTAVATAGKSLTSFSTLRSILNFLAETLPVNGSAAFRVTVPEPNTDAAPVESNGVKKNRPVSRNGDDHAPRGASPNLSGFASAFSNGDAPGSDGPIARSESLATAAEDVRGIEPTDEIPDAARQLFGVAAGTGLEEARERGQLRGRRHAAEIRGALQLLIDTEQHSTATWEPEPAVRQELAGLARGAGVLLPAVLHAHSIFHRAEAPALSEPETHSPSIVDGETKSFPDDVFSVPSLATPEEQQGPPLTPDQSMRFAMRIARAPQRRGMPVAPAFSGPALVVGHNDLAFAIRRRFEASGQPCLLVPEVSSLTELDEWLKHTWSAQLTPHLFITTSHDDNSLRAIDARAWQSRRLAAVEVPYRVCQLWMQRMIDAGKMDGASVVAALNLGGDFGFSGETCESPEGGLGGLIKAMLIEAWMRGFRATPMKVIDLAPHTSLAQAVEGIWRELAIPSYDMEVALHGDERFAIQPVFKPLPHSSAERHAGTTRVRRGGTWVVTGGARGITAVVVRELARRHQLKLHLLGTAPSPQVTDELREAAAADRLKVRRAVMAAAAERNQNGMEAWRNVEKALEIDATLRLCQAEGITARYHCCDVSDLDKLEATLQQIRDLDGPVRGVIHGAGIGQDARFDRKRPDKVDQCLRAKIDGCINLMDATRGDPLDSFVAFGSISGRFGANGHTDYSFANDSLAKLMGRYRRERPEVASVTFHWHAWGDIGMATKPETKLALEMINLEFMPAAEGIAHFLNELEVGGDEPEVLITDRAYYRKFFPIDRNVLPADPTVPGPASFPLLDPEADLSHTHSGRFAIELNPEKERFLNQHLVQGKPTLPFVVALELMAEAARATTGHPAVLEARDVQAQQAIKWATQSPLTVHVAAERTPAGISCALIADVRRRDGRIVAKDRTYFQGLLTTGTPSTPRFVKKPDVSQMQWNPVVYLEPTAPIYHGPDLQCLQSMAVEGNQAVGQISASSTVQLGGGHRPTFGWSVHCAAMDACLYASALFAGKCFGRASLPVRFGRISFGRLPDPGEPCLVCIQLVEETTDGALLAFQLIGLNNELLLDVDDYQVGWLL